MTVVKRIKNAHLVINIIDLKSDTIVLIIPGGGYRLLSNRESGPVATKFNMLGYNTAVLYYSCLPLVPLEEGKEALKELSKEYKNIVAIGFSAGGHLVGLLGTEKEKYNLKAIVLCYAVISFMEYSDKDTAHNFLGNTENSEGLIKYSIQNRVNNDTVPTYIWTTKEDEIVPYENSLMMIDALKKNNVYYEYKIYEHGKHGLALADETAVVNGDLTFTSKEIANWPNNVSKFIEKILNR